MAKLRKNCAYRRIERAYTRVSKFRKKSYIRITPTRRIVRYIMGNPRGKYEYTLDLITNEQMQIRDNSIESARQTGNRLLERNLAKNYFLRIMIFCHHILRENPLAAGAGADRMSTGMKHSFGKPIGVAARCREGQILFQLQLDKNHVDLGKKALKRAASKLPCNCSVVVTKNN